MQQQEPFRTRKVALITHNRFNIQVRMTKVRRRFILRLDAVDVTNDVVRGRLLAFDAEWDVSCNQNFNKLVRSVCCQWRTRQAINSSQICHHIMRRFASNEEPIVPQRRYRRNAGESENDAGKMRHTGRCESGVTLLAMRNAH
jgi:hypothetical protein